MARARERRDFVRLRFVLRSHFEFVEMLSGIIISVDFRDQGCVHNTSDITSKRNSSESFSLFTKLLRHTCAEE